jgi:uncharacterized protein YdeI (YjbR/CyaY-like superfamily)
MEITTTIYAPDRDAWRAWLAEHGASATEIWLVFYKKGTGKPSPTYDEAVEEALCYGWIDGIRRSIDAERHALRFTPRRPGGAWSTSNRARVQRLAREGRMTAAGMALLPADWQADPAQFERPRPELEEIPDFIKQALEATPGLPEKFEALSRSVKRNYLGFILDAKREETRKKRLAFVLAHVESGEKIDFMKPLRLD